MIPTLFEIPIFGGIPIHSFGLMMAAAFLTSSFVLRRLFKNAGYSEELSEKIILVAAIAGLAGSKLYYLFFEAFERFKKYPMEMLFSGAGLTWYGGFVLATISIIYLLKKNKIPVLRGVDLIAIPLPLGYGIGRIGCHLSGDGDYGLPWDGPWATNYSRGVVPPSQAFHGSEIARQYPNGIVPDNTLCHPTPLYETLISTGIFLILWHMSKRKLPAGSIISLYLMLAGMERFFIEFMRLNPKVAFGLSGAQLISVVMITAGAGSLAYLWKRATA
ncbi:prolipoprotein diacylglyceryl transferase [bacterium]|nr:prolipoprotein diacylglyceryl transferase [bacterium]NUN46419.1 prolipoprotein diacylglyceryl transferase [bacterium]